ncbi:MAG: hypothetical protein QM811_06840 [Pirellulales bacterium]
MNHSTKTINGVSYTRTSAMCDVGTTLYQMESTDGGTPELLGTVASVDRREADNQIIAITLDNGRRLTKRGWQSKRVWRAA